MGGTGWIAFAAAAVLLAGCAGAQADVSLEARAKSDGDGWLLVAEATNQGAEPIVYRHGCKQAWDHTLERQGEPVDMGVAPCHGFEPAELAPGDTHRLRVEWDGAQWGKGGRQEAPPAAYVWHVSFLDIDGHALASDTAVINKGQAVNQGS